MKILDESFARKIIRTLFLDKAWMTSTMRIISILFILFIFGCGKTPDHSQLVDSDRYLMNLRGTLTLQQAVNHNDSKKVYTPFIVGIESGEVRFAGEVNGSEVVDLKSYQRKLKISNLSLATVNNSILGHGLLFSIQKPILIYYTLDVCEPCSNQLPFFRKQAAELGYRLITVSLSTSPQ